MRISMALFRKQYANPDLESKTLKVGIDGGDGIVIRPTRPTVLTEEMGRWDNADQIHNWFVRNIHNGKNEPGEMIVTRAQLAKLLEDTREVVKRSYLIPSRTFFGRKLGKGISDESPDGTVIVDTSAARKLLPVSGRFLGRKYDEQYMYDLHQTINILLEALDANPDAYYTYQASW
jgi:hypothetical protein